MSNRIDAARPRGRAAVMEAPDPLAAGAADLARGAGVVALFAALTALSGLVRVPLPFTPVPLTLQVLPVLLAGALIGPSRAAASQALFLGSGALGLPVFAGGAAGLAWLTGPTGGYLAGFLAAAWLVGAILRRTERPGFGLTLAAMTAGAAVIHALGVLQLSIHSGGSILRAFQLGSLPFLPGTVLKVLAAASLATAWRRSRRTAP